MADVTLAAKLTADTREFVSKMKSAEVTLNNVAGGIGKIGAGAAAAGAAFATFAVKAISAAEKQELAERKLAAALANTGQFSDELFTSLKKQASALQEVTTIGDEVSIELQSMAVTMGATGEQAGEIVKVAADVSAALGIDMKTAVRGVSQTLSGQAGVLGRYVPQLRDLGEESLRSGKAIDVMGKQFAGFAKTEAQTFGGAMTQVMNAVGDSVEEMGARIKKTGGVQVLIANKDSVIRGLQDILKSFGSFAANAVDIGGRVTLFLADAWADATGKIKKAVVAITTSVARMLAYFDDDFKAIADLMDQQIVGEFQAIQSETDATREKIGDLMRDFDELAGKSLDMSMTNATPSSGAGASVAGGGGSGPGGIAPGDDGFAAALKERQGERREVAKEMANMIGAAFRGALEDAPPLEIGRQSLVGGGEAALSALKPEFSGLIAAGEPLLQAMLENPKQIGEMVQNMTMAIVDTIITLIGNIGVVFADLMRQLDEIVIALVKALVTELPPALAKLIAEALKGLFFELPKAIAQALADILGKVAKGVGGFFKEVGSRLKEGGLFRSGGLFRRRAGGGELSPGMPTLVGERGPEMIIPKTSGTVIPNNELGGGGVVANITIVADRNPNVTAQMVEQALMRLSRQGRLAVNPVTGVGR